MPLRSITLQDFGRHSNLTVDLSPSVNLICGENYAGKSTVLQAVLVALLGSVSGIGSMKELVRSGQKTYKLTLSGDNEQGQWTIVRTNKDCTCTVNAVDKAVGHTSCNSWIQENIIKKDKTSFMLSNYSEQGETQSLLNMEGAQLVKYVEKQVGIEKIDRLSSACGKRIAASKAIVEITKVLSKDERRELVKEKAEADSHCTLLPRKKEQKQSAIDKLQKDRDEQDVVRTETIANHTVWANFSDRLARAETDLVMLVAPSHTDTWLDDQEEGVKKQEVQLALDAIPEPVLLPLQENVPQEKEEAVVNLKAKKAQLSSLKAAQSKGVCSLCGTVLALDKGHLDKEVEKEEKNLESLQKVAEEALAKFKVYESSQAANKATEGKKEKRTELLKQLNRYKNVSDPQLTSGEIRRERKEIVGYFAKKEQLEDRVKEQKPTCLNPTKAEVEALGTVIDNLNSALQTLKDEVRDVDVALAEQSALSRVKKAALEADDLCIANLLEAERDLTTCTDIRTHLIKVREEVVQGAWQMVMVTCEAFVKEVTDGYIDRVFLGDGVIRFSEAGEVRGARARASGAQKTLIGLGLKMGIFRLSSRKVDFLLLDEPTADMSVENSARCMQALGKTLPGTQLVVVTHRSDDTADNVILLGD